MGRGNKSLFVAFGSQTKMTALPTIKFEGLERNCSKCNEIKKAVN